MNTISPLERRRIPPRISVLITAVIIFVLVFLTPSSMLLPISSSGLAKYRAEIKLRNIPMPDGMRKIASFSVGDIDRPSCYAGEASMFGATDLSASEIKNFYDEYFAGQNWDLRSELEPRFYFAVTSKQKVPAGRAVEGFAIQVCDDKCISRYDSLGDVITDAQKESKNVYVLYTWFVPYEVRDNLCWCCNGG